MKEEIVLAIYFTIVSLMVFVSLLFIGSAFFSDETSKQRVRKFGLLKGCLYFLLAVVSFVYDIIIRQSISMTVFLTICIAIGEAAQGIATFKSEEYKDKPAKTMQGDVQNKDTTLKDIEKIYTFCVMKLDLLRGHESLDLKRLVYEMIYDYLHYYSLADEFFNVYDGYIKGEKTLVDVNNALDELKKD